MSASLTPRRRALGLAGATILAFSLLGTASASRAGERWREHEFREHEFHERAYFDARYHHDRYYPPVGFAFGALPAGYIAVRHQGLSFYFAGGIWYSAPAPGRFVVVAPPIGVVVPVLPPYYATVWVGGVPYYYANNVYYAQSPQGYVVVNPPPPATVVEVPPTNVVAPPPVTTVYKTPAAQVSMYPNHGQSAQQQAKDRYECHNWAVGESHYDPSLPNGPGGTEQQIETYRRSLSACLDARGYTVW